jgi:hypothetical protein
MASQNIPVTYSGTVASDLGIIVNTSGAVFVGVTPGNPNEVLKLLSILDAARNVVVANYTKALNPNVVQVPLRGATGF